MKMPATETLHRTKNNRDREREREKKEKEREGEGEGGEVGKGERRKQFSFLLCTYVLLRQRDCWIGGVLYYCYYYVHDKHSDALSIVLPNRILFSKNHSKPIQLLLANRVCDS